MSNCNLLVLLPRIELGSFGLEHLAGNPPHRSMTDVSSYLLRLSRRVIVSLL